MDDQHAGDKILHQDAVEDVIEKVLEESGGSFIPAFEMEMNNAPASIAGGAGQQPLLWDTFYDIDNASVVFPGDDLGLTYDVLTGVFTASERGRWLVEANSQLASDASALGGLALDPTNPSLNSGTLIGRFRQSAPRPISVIRTIDRPIGGAFRVIVQISGATGNPYAAINYAVGKITRLA